MKKLELDELNDDDLKKELIKEFIKYGLNYENQINNTTSRNKLNNYSLEL
jgi:hypothetical protein